MATKDQVYEFARQEAQRQGVPFSFVQKIIDTESGGRFDARGPKTRSGETAFGPMQLMPGTAKDLGVNRMDWKDNIRGGIAYINQLSQRFNDPSLVAAAYNAGPGNVERYGGVPPFKETQNYVQKVVGTSMATFRDIDPSMIGQATNQPQQQTVRQATPVQQAPQNAGFRDIDPSMIGPAVPAPTPARQNNNSIGRQLGLTARYGLEGAGQIADIIGSPLNNLINRATGSNLAPPSQGMSNLATSLGLPQPQGGFEQGIAGVTRAVAGIPTLAGPANLMRQFGNQATQAVGRGLAAQPGAQAAAATAGTGAAEIANRGFDIQNPLALLGINLAAGLPAGAAASRTANIPSGTRYQDPRTGQLIESAANRGVQVDVGDVGGPGAGTLDKLRQLGFSKETANQQKSSQVQNLVEKVTDDLRPPNMAVGGEKRVIANDLRTQYRQAKNAVSPIFNRAENLAGNTQIPLGNTNNATINVLDQFPATSDTTVISKTIDRINNLLQAGGGTYKELRDVQKTVGAELSRVQKGIPGGSYSETQQNALSQLYKGLGDDVDAWAAPRTLNGKPVYTPAGAEHAKAMEQFRQTVVPFRQDASIYKIVSSKTPSNDIDKVAESFSFTSNPATSELAFNLMSPVGQRAAQFSILNEARSKAITADASADFSAPAFTRTLNLGRPDNPTPQRIALGANPQVLEDVSLLRDIVDTTRGAVTPKVAPQTGAALLPYLVGGGGMATGAGLGATAGQALGMGPMGTAAFALGAGSAFPRLSGFAADAMSSLPATRFALGEQLQGAAGMAAPIGQGINAATTNPENFIPGLSGYFDFAYEK
jgi:hypothetical protein